MFFANQSFVGIGLSIPASVRPGLLSRPRWKNDLRFQYSYA